MALEFEWDERKNEANIKKHGINFFEAARVFEDVKRLEFYDEAHSLYEERYNVIGYVRDVLFVVYTERDNFVEKQERIRIISARPATERERRMYYDG